MPIHYRSLLTLENKDLISEKFNFLTDFFDFEPGDIFIEIFHIDDFDKFYELERKRKPAPFIVGSVLNNGRIIVLDKKDFEKKENHVEAEFPGVILHELAHLFIRRMTWLNNAFIWIQEGICEYLSFGKNRFKLKNFIPFNKIESEEGWNKYNPYPQAGAFFKFLSENYGDKKIVSFVKGLKENSKRQIKYLEEVFFEKFEELESEFRKTHEN